jgi:hypothetical protein
LKVDGKMEASEIDYKNRIRIRISGFQSDKDKNDTSIIQNDAKTFLRAPSRQLARAVPQESPQYPLAGTNSPRPLLRARILQPARIKIFAIF